MLAAGESGGCRAAMFSVSLAMFCCTAVRADALPASEFVLRWDVAAGCPDRATPLRAILDFLQQRGARAASGAEAGVVIVQRPDALFEATIRLQDASGSGERYFEGSSCPRVAEAVALIIAMTLESTRVAERLSVTPAPPPRAAPGPDAVDRLRLSIGVRSAGDLGSLPQPSLGVAAVVGAHLGALQAEAEFSAWLPRLAESGSSSGSAGEIGLFGAALRGCYQFIQNSGHTFGFGPCLGAEAGAAIAHGIRVADDGPHSAFWAAALAGLTFRQLAVSGVGTWLSVEAGLPLLRPNYVILDVEQNARHIFRAEPVVGRVAVGVRWFF